MKAQHYKAEEKQAMVAPFKCPLPNMCVLHIIARLSGSFYILSSCLFCFLGLAGYIFLNILSLNRYFLIHKLKRTSNIKNKTTKKTTISGECKCILICFKSSDLSSLSNNLCPPQTPALMI